jgi:hypothetical protein
VLELRQRFEIRDLRGGEPQVQEIFDRLGQPGRENKIAVPRQTPHK